jgi:hypothetical protein
MTASFGATPRAGAHARMRNVLSDGKRQQILAPGRLGSPLPRIEAETGVRRETSSVYPRAARISVRRACGRGHAKPANDGISDPAGDSKPAKDPIPDSDVAKPANETIPDSTWPTASRSPSSSACEVHRDFIEEALGRGRNAKAICQDVVVERGILARYSSVLRCVQKLRGARVLEAHPVIETRPGEEARVDYGEGLMVRDASTGKYRRTRLFVMTPGYSRKSVRLLSWRSSTKTWCELHERSYRRVGGAPRIVVLDNLKEGALAPDVYDPAVNPLYREMITQYGAVALPCRVRHPYRNARSSGASATPSAPRSRAFASRPSKTPTVTSITGTRAGPTRASTAPPRGRSRRCFPRRSRTSCHCPSSRFVTTATESAQCTSTARTTRRRRARLGTLCSCRGTSVASECSTHAPARCFVSTRRNCAVRPA